MWLLENFKWLTLHFHWTVLGVIEGYIAKLLAQLLAQNKHLIISPNTLLQIASL